MLNTSILTSSSTTKDFKRSSKNDIPKIIMKVKSLFFLYVLCLYISDDYPTVNSQLDCQ